MIILSARVEEDILIITVMDTGPGIEAPELEALNRRLSLDNDTYFKELSDSRKV